MATIRNTVISNTVSTNRIKAMIFALVFILIILNAVPVYLFLISRGKPAYYKDADGNIPEGSISEKVFVNIGGVRQGMFIRSSNIDNPVLLYLHGGPGFPNYFMVEKFNPGLEEHFTVCYWEQRGGGLSWSEEVTVESMTLDQLAGDAIELTRYLRERFGKEKIYILALSGGTTIALPAVARAPEFYHAYIAMAQLTRQRESEKIAFDYIMKQYSEINNRRMLKKLEKYRGLETDSDVLSFYNSGIRDMTMHELGIGTMRTMKSILRDIFIPVWTCRAYTIREKIQIWKSKFRFLPATSLRTETLFTDFAEKYPEIEVPVWFMSGRHDLTVNVGLAEDYYNNLKAPDKRLYIFENSAHSPLFEEPERFMEVIAECAGF